MEKQTIRSAAEFPGFPGLPTQEPLLSIELENFPSVNEVLYLTPIARSGLLRAERSRGYRTGIRAAQYLGIEVKTERVKVRRKRGSFYEAIERAQKQLTDKPLFCYVEVWRQASKKDAEKSDRKRDVYNLCVKSFIDGLTDSGLWADDSESYHTDFWIHYAGVTDKPRATMSFFEAGT